MVLEKLYIHMQKNEHGLPTLTTYKHQLKWIKDLNMILENGKLLGKIYL